MDSWNLLSNFVGLNEYIFYYSFYIHTKMIYSKEVENMCSVCKGAYHGPAPIPEEGKWIQAKEIKDISGYTHGIGWCAPQQGACKLSGWYHPGGFG